MLPIKISKATSVKVLTALPHYSLVSINRYRLAEGLFPGALKYYAFRIESGVGVAFYSASYKHFCLKRELFAKLELNLVLYHYFYANSTAL